MLSLEFSLSALFLSSFISATLMPGGSEAVLFGVLNADAGLLWPAIGVATVGNTLGGMTSYWLGRLLPEKKHPGRALDWVHRHGSAALLLAWVPLVGDALCVAAGWLRVNAWLALLFMTAGKFARYLAVAWVAV